MQTTACKNSTGPTPLKDGVQYTTVSEAMAALTPQNLLWLARLAARRLRKLRSHPGLARYLAGKEPAELVDEAIQRLQLGSRKTKPKHLASHQTFLNHLQSVINSVANNYTRHAEPHVEHSPLGLEETAGPYVDPAAGQDVRREVIDREWLYWIFQVLERSVSIELQSELARLRKTEPGLRADQIIGQCSERLLEELQHQLRAGIVETPELAN